MIFDKLDLKHKELVEKYNKFANPLSSVHNFTAIYTWKDPLDIEICEEEGILYLHRNKPEFGFLPPLMEDWSRIGEAVKKMKNYSYEKGFKPVVIDAEQYFIDRLNDSSIEFRSEEDRDNSEYVYDVQKLKRLSGKKYHGKKNHYNHFIKNLNYEVKDLKDSFEDALRVGKKWIEGKETDYTLGELKGIHDAFENFDLLNLKGIAVYVDGVCEAFTISEDIPNNNVLIHIEKANDLINGVYTFVNSMNLQVNHPDSVKVNREQDLGIEGLRKAKLSWKPIEMVDKFKIYL